jgi:alpha-tubulin suppressor-like RCC1 family protein
LLTLTPQVSAGHTFSLFLTNTGQVYAAGSSESGQLGNGKTGKSRFTPSPIQMIQIRVKPC